MQDCLPYQESGYARYNSPEMFDEFVHNEGYYQEKAAPFFEERAFSPRGGYIL